MISVIIPFFNEISLIKRAVESVWVSCDNNFDFEVIISNDGYFSEAEIRSAVSPPDNSKLKIIKNCGIQGPGGARNAALNIANGEYIAFLDADDYWLNGKLKIQLKYLNDGYTFVTTGYSFIGYDAYIAPPAEIGRSLDIFIKRGIGTSTVMISRKLLSNQRFKDVRFSQDIDFWYRLSESNEFKYFGVNKACVMYSKSGSTKNKWEQLKSFSCVLKLNNITLFNKFKILSSYIIFGIFNHWIKTR